MTWAQLVLMGALVLGAAPDDPAALVTRLGAPRYADRQAAARALEALGVRALPALRNARQSPDAEVRVRAAELIGRIEAERLVRPTVVRLDFTDTPLPAVVAALSERTGIPIGLVPENSPIWQARKVTLQASEPVTFWQALDRLCAAAGLRHTIAQDGVLPGRDAVVQLFAGGPPGDLVADASGPFRITVEGIHYHLDRRFGGAGQPVRALPAGGGIGRQDDGSISRQFFLDLQVVAEPRMILSQSGPLKLTEAIDDQGNNLLPPVSSDAVIRSAGYFGGGFSTTTLQMQAHMTYPDRPGATIKRLRGTIPVVIAARKDDPLIIPLGQAKGRTYQTESVELTIHDIQDDPNHPRSTIELSLRPLGPEGESLGGGGIGAELLALRAPNMPQSQIEILDAQGRPYRQWFPSSTRLDQQEAHMTLTLMSDGEVGPPAQLRFYDLNRASAEVTFEFEDIPMF